QQHRCGRCPPSLRWSARVPLRDGSPLSHRLHRRRSPQWQWQGLDRDLPRGRDSRCSRVLSRRLRSEEHTSELQSRFDLVCRLLPATTSIHTLSLHDALPICSSTDVAGVRRLFDGARASLFATDPPYLIDYTGADRPNGSGKDWTATYHEVEIPDALAFYRAA